MGVAEVEAEGAMIDYNFWEAARESYGCADKKFWHELPSSARELLGRYGWTRQMYDLKCIEIIKGIPQPRGFREGLGGQPVSSMDVDPSPWEENNIRYLEECR